MLVAASRTVPVDDEKVSWWTPRCGQFESFEFVPQMSRTFDRRIRELEDVIEHLTKATDRVNFEI